MELKSILTELQPLNLAILGNFLHCRVWSLCNQLVLQFSMDHFETLHSCCVYIEDVHVNFLADEKIFFDKIRAFPT